MKTVATRCTELYVECPKCKNDITHIPLKDIDSINVGNTEKLVCQRCKCKIEITKVEN